MGTPPSSNAAQDRPSWRLATRSAEHELALVALLKGYQRLGYFPELIEVPVQVAERIRGLPEPRPRGWPRPASCKGPSVIALAVSGCMSSPAGAVGGVEFASEGRARDGGARPR